METKAQILSLTIICISFGMLIPYFSEYPYQCFHLLTSLAAGLSMLKASQEDPWLTRVIATLLAIFLWPVAIIIVMTLYTSLEKEFKLGK